MEIMQLRRFAEQTSLPPLLVGAVYFNRRKDAC
jgi:hypothetical protein